MTTYVFDQAWHAERERLAALERIWDPATFAFLAELGIRPGWRCLEVGAGAGLWRASCGASLVPVARSSRQILTCASWAGSTGRAYGRCATT